MSDSSGKLKLGALVALVVGSMIGGGIFSLPQNMAASAGVGAVPGGGDVHLGYQCFGPGPADHRRLAG